MAACDKDKGGSRQKDRQPPILFALPDGMRVHRVRAGGRACYWGREIGITRYLLGWDGLYAGKDLFGRSPQPKSTIAISVIH